MAAEVVDAVARSQIAGLSEKVDSHLEESQRSHNATATKLDAQAIILARMEERAEAEVKANTERRAAEEKARLERESHTWSPQKIAAVVGGIVAILSALGYGGSRVAESAVASPPSVTIQTQAPEASP